MTAKASGSRKSNSPPSSTQNTSDDSFSKLPLLASTIALPPDYCISFIRLDALNSQHGHQDVDSARRDVLRNNQSRILVDSLLPYSQVDKDHLSLWVFCVESPASSRLDDLGLNNLEVSIRDHFSYQELYPCSVICASQRTPCPTCLKPPFPPVVPTPPPLYRERSSSDNQVSSTASSPTPYSISYQEHDHAACHVPRQPLQEPLCFFLNAVRDRLIDELCEAAKYPGGIRRLRSGILLGGSSRRSNWGDDWSFDSYPRPFTHCFVLPTLYQSDILIEYKLQPTSLAPLLPSLPLPSGTPLTLLPYATPGYFLSVYSGATSALVKQFDPYLLGIGAGCWSQPNAGMPQFVIVWISVQNDQGEEKGLVAVWPALLCASVLTQPSCNDALKSPRGFAYGRKMLYPLPELPPALQPSPVPAPAVVPGKQQALSSPVSPLVSSASVLQNNSIHANFRRKQRPLFVRSRSSLSSGSIRTFRQMAILYRPSREIGKVAVNVGKYVDSVAKERERERERIRREREAAQQAAKTPVNQMAEKQERGTGVTTAVTTMPDIYQTAKTDFVVQADEEPMMIDVEQPSPPVDTSHRAYPSPPNDHERQNLTSGAINQLLANSNITVMPERPAVNFIPFGELDNSWMNNNDFMMDLSTGIDFSADDVPPTSALDAGISNDTMTFDIDNLGVFTDDDFNFFDSEPLSKLASTSINGPSDVNLITSDELANLADSNPSMIIPSPLFVSGEHIDPILTPFEAPWTTSRAGHAIDSPFTSLFASQSQPILTSPGLAPPSPTKSFSTQSAPTTPNVILTSDPQVYEHLGGSTGLEVFDALKFANGHGLVDSKYMNGKFGLSRSLSEKPTDNVQTFTKRQSYRSLTDPRVATVMRLVRAKSSNAVEKSTRPSILSREGSGDWKDILMDDCLDEESDQEQESDDNASIVDEEEHDVQFSRPSTPLPSYLPLGPSLLSTQFLHGNLHPLSTNLRPPGAAFHDMDVISPAANAVPTPVSPSAALGLSAEKLKTLESAVRIVFNELVSNPVWARAWQENLSKSADLWPSRQEVWPEDVRCLSQCIHSMKSLTASTSFEKLALIASPNDVVEGYDVLTDLPHPPVLVGKTDAVARMSHSALQFWDKLALTPKSGTKDVMAIVVTEDQDDIASQAEEWLQRVSTLYTAKGYGLHEVGNNSSSDKAGIFRMRYDSFRKNWGNLLQVLPMKDRTTILYIITSTSMQSLSSSAFRHLLSGMKRVTASQPDASIYYHLIPYQALQGVDGHMSIGALHEIVDSVYNRIPRPTDRMRSRAIFEHGESARKRFEAPAYTLGRPSPESVSFSPFKYPPFNTGVTDRHTFLHIGYTISDCQRWLFGMCVDERGESHNVEAWFLKDSATYERVVSKLWDFAMKFAAQANVEWRIVIAKLGGVSGEELNAWLTLLSEKMQNDTSNSATHVSIVCVEETLWMVDEFPAEDAGSSTKKVGNNTASKEKLFSLDGTTFLLSNIQRPLSSSDDKDIYLCLAHVPEEKDGRDQQSEGRVRPSHTSVVLTTTDSALHIRNHPAPYSLKAHYVHLISTIKSSRSTIKTSDKETLRDICHNFLGLAILGRSRWHFTQSPTLPAHLAAVFLARTTIISGLDGDTRSVSQRAIPLH